MRVRAILVSTVALFIVIIAVQRRFLRRYRKIVGDYYTTDDARVSSSLLKDLKTMASIALPTIWSREGLGSILFVTLFAVKATLRVVMSTADGNALTAMVAGRPSPAVSAPVASGSRQFLSIAVPRSPLKRALMIKISVSLASAAVSGFIEHLRHWLITAYRGRLTRYFHARFYDKLVYYHGTALDSRLESADTVITNYCGEFAEHFAELPYYFVLPLLEAGTSLAALVRQSGTRTGAYMTSVVLLSLAALRNISPPFGRIHAAVLQREDEFRKMHTNAIANVEQIAMHDAGTFTKRRLDQQFGCLSTALNEMSLAKGHFESLEGAITTVWSVAAHAIASMSQSVAGGDGSGRRRFVTADDLTQFRKSKAARLGSAVVQLRLIHDFNASVKDFIVNFREVSHLSEFTTKLAAFEETLDSVAQGNFYSGGGGGFCSTSPSSKEPSLCTPDTRGSHIRLATSRRPGCSEPDTLVSFQDVDVGNPGGSLLVHGLTLDIKRGQDWAIVGPNGCGKTSILRLLSNLWPPRRGRLITDASVLFVFLPQQPYLLPSATMIEQVCFPDEPQRDVGPIVGTSQLPELQPLQSSASHETITKDEFRMVREALSMATGSSIVDHLGGWGSDIVGVCPCTADRSFDWSSLSGGQRQKLAISRAFYHAMKASTRSMCCVCVLDESTSMMDHEAEQQVFLNLKRHNIRFLSVTHREEVLQHHTHILTLSRDPHDWGVSCAAAAVPASSQCPLNGV